MIKQERQRNLGVSNGSCRIMGLRWNMEENMWVICGTMARLLGKVYQRGVGNSDCFGNLELVVRGTISVPIKGTVTIGVFRGNCLPEHIVALSTIFN